MRRPISVAVLSPVTGGPYYGEIVAGVTREIGAAGGRVVLLQTFDAGHSRDDALGTPDFTTPTAWDAVDGVVSITTAVPRAYLERLRAAGKPVVPTSANVEGFDAPSVSPDNDSGIHSAVAHLIEHGHRRIGFAANLVQSDMRERYDAYQFALRAHGIEPDPTFFFAASDNGEAGGRGVGRALLANGVPVTALVAATDRNAIGVMSVLADAGVSVPGDLAVVGFDDIELGSFSSPTLSTVSQHFDEVGALAGRLLLVQLRGEAVGHYPHRSPSTFVPRESCGCDNTRRTPSVPIEVGTASLLAGRLRDLLLSGRADPAARGALAGRVAEYCEALAEAARTGVAVPDRVASDLAALVIRFDPSPEELRGVVEAATEHIYGIGAAAHGIEPAGLEVLARGAAQVSAALWHAQARSYLDRSYRREGEMVEQYEIGMRLLDRERADPRRLEWMVATDVRAGCLALWDGDPARGRLRIAGVYDPDDTLPQLVGSTVAVEQFPPAPMLAHADARNGEITFVIPVRVRGTDWGMLGVVGQIDSTSASGRETYNQWAALLASSFEQDVLQASIRASEERYGLVARATNDGLWDWNLADDTIFYSARCTELLGNNRPSGNDAPSLWFDAVHPDDRKRLREVLDDAVNGEHRPIELEHRVRAAEGGYRYLLCRALPIGPDAGPAVRIVGSLSDINPRKQLEERLRQGALYDEVTGLANRKLFRERLTFAISQARRSSRMRYAVLFLDLDGFKLVNDSLGHLAGDRLLTKVGERLQSGLREVDIAARFGGDEFAVLLHDIEPGAVRALVERMQQTLAEPIDLDGHDVRVTASVGITTSAGGYTNAEDVLRDADIAMYHAKSLQRGSQALFDVDMLEGAAQQLGLQSDLRRALDEGQFEVHYQPIVDLDSVGVEHFEALVRWRHPERGLVQPADFLPVMEETGLIVALGRWVFEDVCRQIAEWKASYAGHTQVSVNVSDREFWHDGLLTHVVGCLARHGLTPDHLTIEITEGVIARKPDLALKVMSDLRDAGIDLHVDDFGTGHSSLQALHRFPVQALKIDRAFVHDLGVDPRTADLVEIILAMGHALGVEVIAEGVETQDQLDKLRAMGCHKAQGFWFSGAVDGAAAAGLLGCALPITHLGGAPVIGSRVLEGVPH